MTSTTLHKQHPLLFILSLVILFSGLWSPVSAGVDPQNQERPLTLEEALKLALEKNKDIQKAKEYRNLVEGKYVEERAAALPQLTGRAGLSRDRDESQAAYNRFFPVERETRGAGVGLNQVLYTFGQVEFGYPGRQNRAENGRRSVKNQPAGGHQGCIFRLLRRPPGQRAA